MASPRITNTMRQGIVKNTIDHTFKKERDAIDRRESELALLAYNEKYTALERKCFESCPDLFGVSNGMHLNIRGMSISIGFGKDTQKPVAESHTWGNRFTPSTKLSDAVYELTNDREDLKKRVREAEVQLMAVLESVQSFKKLRAVWPQGEKFYDMYDVDYEKAGVPSIVVSELNKVLGIK